jgi:AGCS family alanine or glycine:cation symporter
MIVAGQFSQQSKPDVEALSSWYAGSNDSGVQPFSGVIPVQDGIAMVGDAFTVLHARSLAEEVVYLQNGAPFSGELEIVAGQPTDPQVSLRGKSLLHSAALTTRAFSFGIFGENGGYIVTLSLVLFAFSTAIAWSYYGDRAMIFMFGSSAVVPYRVVYCIGFFVASFADTTLVWNFAAIGMVVMAIPNLLGLLLLRREMKDAITSYKTRL